MYALANLDILAIAGVAGLIALVVPLILIILLVRQNRLLRRYRALLQGNATENLESLLLHQAQTITRLEGEVTSLSHQIDAFGKDAERHLQKMGVVRFNAFPDTGSDLSFAIALLDGHDNGVVLSNLYGRTESRVYAKPVAAGASTYPLSGEEREAVAKALAARNNLVPEQGGK